MVRKESTKRNNTYEAKPNFREICDCLHTEKSEFIRQTTKIMSQK